MQRQVMPYINLAIAQFSVGANVVIMKYVIPRFPVYVLLEIRFFLTCVFLGLIAFLTKQNIWPRSHEPKAFTKNECLIMITMSVCGGVLFNLIMPLGVKLTSATSAGIIASTTPAMIAVLSFWVLRERFNNAKWAALGLAILGILILNLHGEKGSFAAAHNILGDFLVLLAVVPEALYTVFGKLLGNRISALRAAMIINLANTICFLPLAMMQMRYWDPHVLQSVSMLGLGVLSGVLGVGFYYCWQLGLNKVSAGTAAIFASCMPVGAVICAIAFLGEQFTLFEAGGMLAVLLSIVIGSEILQYRSGFGINPKTKQAKLEES